MFDEFKGAFNRPNNAHAQLIIINVVIFLALAFVYVFSHIAGFARVFDLIYNQFTIPPRLADFVLRPWTFITYGFAHSMDLYHILFNMLFLYWFGKLFIEFLGSDKLIAVYVLGVMAGGLVYLILFNTVPYFVERSGFSGMVGASAAVYAVMVAVATLLPNYTFHLLLLGPIRIKYIAAFYILLSFLGTVGGNIGGNLAHLGGALMGYIYIKQLQAGVNWGSWITVTLDWFRGLTRPSPKVKVTYRKAPNQASRSSAASGVSQAEIDAILDKINAGGYENLTKEEKEKLFNASKK